MEKLIMSLKVCYSDLLAEYKRIIKKYYDKLDDHQKEEDCLEEYDRYYNRSNCVSLNQFQDDFFLLSYDFYCFLKYYEIKENEINDKFHYVFTYTETNDSLLENFNKFNEINSNQIELI